MTLVLERISYAQNYGIDVATVRSEEVHAWGPAEQPMSSITTEVRRCVPNVAANESCYKPEDQYTKLKCFF